MYQNSKIEIIYGTGNKAKVEAMKKIIKEHDFNVSIKTVKDINFDEEIVEDGITFEENSEIKARAIQKFCKKNNILNGVIITDDAGLCIDKLNGEPGVHTARYAGENPTQIENITKVLNNMKQYTNPEDRTCTFVCVLTAIVIDTNEKIVARGECRGTIAKVHGRLGGLTYGPIFIPEGFSEPMSEMPEERYESVHNHRDIAMKKIMQELKKIFE